MRFNPTMVRLLLTVPLVLGFLPEFQSHNGAIAAQSWRPRQHAQNLGFNPTMVRLLPDIGFRNITIGKPFQSHNGAIAARHNANAFAQVSQFQSHNGAIAAMKRYRVANMDDLVSIPQWCDCCTQIIQSQPNSVTRFNPTMVRLLLCIVFLEVLALLVSIPQWCDCCLMQIVDILSARKGFNPTMVRLLRKRR